MSTWAIVAIAVGGTLLFAGGMIAIMIRLGRAGKAEEQAKLQRLNEEVAKRGWKYEERNDEYVSLFKERNEYGKQPLFQLPTRQNPLAPLQEWHRPPRARKATQVITGVHRGRPFIAALFDVVHDGENYGETAIWVRTPAPGPALSVFRSSHLEQGVRKGMGQRDLQLGHPEFDDQYEVSEADERFARAVLNPAVIGYLLSAQSRFRAMSLLGDQLDFVDQGLTDHRDPEQLIPALDLRCDVLDRIPQSAWM